MAKISRKGKTYNELFGIDKAREMRKNLSKAHKGKKLSEEHKKKIKETTKRLKEEGKINPGSTGMKHTKEWKENHSRLMKGRKITWANKISKSHQQYKTWEDKYGKEKTEELRQLKREINLGKKLSLEVKKKISASRQGININEWEEFTGYKPYTPDFNNKFKLLVRERDSYACVICNGMEEELGYILSVHHVDYIKKNTFSQNCVSLCKTCHNKTLFNRNHWTKFFQSLLAERYGYEYTQDQKIILDFIGDYQ